MRERTIFARDWVLSLFLFGNGRYYIEIGTPNQEEMKVGTPSHIKKCAAKHGTYIEVY
jgi:hypothetical protein